eukprot:TRINITY_DN28055_c0_g1_i6.p1 TRINITY_DN28055_c0_g1~~TRINITY_DN28055_c0_g1_i6.p1  ORF type:complete len:235 (+),score=48.48 TRINITY_DN28055_c0_g1_i6:339-1043(+)
MQPLSDSASQSLAGGQEAVERLAKTTPCNYFASVAGKGTFAHRTQELRAKVNFGKTSAFTAEHNLRSSSTTKCSYVHSASNMPMPMPPAFDLLDISFGHVVADERSRQPEYPKRLGQREQNVAVKHSAKWRTTAGLVLPPGSTEEALHTGCKQGDDAQAVRPRSAELEPAWSATAANRMSGASPMHWSTAPDPKMRWADMEDDDDLDDRCTDDLPDRRAFATFVTVSLRLGSKL